MKKFEFKKIDAFATIKSEGNPAGFIRLNTKKDISTFEMLQIAKELKGFVNEVGYLYRNDSNDFDLKYYSSEREVDFCGHATIAIMYDLIKNDKELINSNILNINTNKGKLQVENRLLKEDAVFIMSPTPKEKENIPLVNNIASVFKIAEEEIETNLPIKVINAGLTTLLLPIKSLHTIINLTPDIEELKDFCINEKIDIIEVFTNKVKNKKNDFRVRVFAPTFGYIEDPATGSGNSALGYYLLEEKMWTKDTVTIEQNGLLDKYNVVKLQTKKDESGINRVLFGGAAITRIEGEYILY
ncbi:MAG: PhzF family phenazine biosynthesis protein [bacterium]|nr:PhzF family phenazine biosynthesis protein [bacterium]